LCSVPQLAHAAVEHVRIGDVKVRDGQRYRRVKGVFGEKWKWDGWAASPGPHHGDVKYRGGDERYIYDADGGLFGIFKGWKFDGYGR
jgi:hypothetical protein